MRRPRRGVLTCVIGHVPVRKVLIREVSMSRVASLVALITLTREVSHVCKASLTTLVRQVPGSQIPWGIFPREAPGFLKRYFRREAPDNFYGVFPDAKRRETEIVPGHTFQGSPENIYFPSKRVLL